MFALKQGRWTRLPLKARTKTLLARRLSFYAPAKANDFETPWFKIVAEGYGDYWVDRNLTCVGPFGIACKLLPNQQDTIKEMLAGKWEDANGPIQ